MRIKVYTVDGRSLEWKTTEEKAKDFIEWFTDNYKHGVYTLQSDIGVEHLNKHNIVAVCERS